MVWAVDENPFAVCPLLAWQEHGYDLSGKAMAKVPALSPLPAIPPDPPESALLVVPAAVTPPEADPHQ